MYGFNIISGRPTLILYLTPCPCHLRAISLARVQMINEVKKKKNIFPHFKLVYRYAAHHERIFYPLENYIHVSVTYYSWYIFNSASSRIGLAFHLIFFVFFLLLFSIVPHILGTLTWRAFAFIFFCHRRYSWRTCVQWELNQIHWFSYALHKFFTSVFFSLFAASVFIPFTHSPLQRW